MNEHVVINSDKTMEIPEWLKDWLVQFDHKTTTITFDCPRYWRGIDLLEYVIYVSVIKKGKEPHTDLCENVSADKNNSEMIHFDWKPTKDALSEKGELSFLICARITEDETVEGAWHTKICRMIKVAEGHECQIVDEEYQDDKITDFILQLRELAKQVENGGASDEKIASAIEAYFVKNPIEPGTGGADLEGYAKLEDINMLTDTITGKRYKLKAVNGNLTMEEVTS